MMLPAIASLVLLHLRAPEWAGASLAIAMLTKPQALLVAPILALGAWRTGGARALAAAAAGRCHHGRASSCCPMRSSAHLPNVWLAFGSFYARRDILSGYAANIWWIANYVLRAWYQIPRLGWVGRVSRAGPADHGDQHVPGARLSEPAAVRRLRSCSSTSAWSLWRIRRSERSRGPCARRGVHRPRFLRAVGRRARAPHDAGGSAARARGGAAGHPSGRSSGR